MNKRLVRALVFILGSGMAAAQAEYQDATVTDPEVHKVVFENEHVRVLEARAAHGAKSHMHSHPARLIVSLGSARLKVAFPDGTSALWDFHPGDFVWVDADVHQWEVIAGEINAFVVEVKSARGANR
jgi:hypothetical protein